MAMIIIGGVSLPNPASYSVMLSDLDSENTTRTETGKLIRTRIRGGLYKIDVSWSGISKAQLKTITDALAPAQISVTFFNPTQSSDTTTMMYAGDKTGALSRHLDESKPDNSRWDLSVSLVEY